MIKKKTKQTQMCAHAQLQASQHATSHVTITNLPAMVTSDVLLQNKTKCVILQQFAYLQCLCICLRPKDKMICFISVITL